MLSRFDVHDQRFLGVASGGYSTTNADFQFSYRIICIYEKRTQTVHLTVHAVLRVMLLLTQLDEHSGFLRRCDYAGIFGNALQTMLSKCKFKW
ncbi:MAG TPA: hypothetical protein VGO47_03095 [Chlamydiales bacterium]|nr:hypothetical protein [Chlamydiales bacterium]